MFGISAFSAAPFSSLAGQLLLASAQITGVGAFNATAIPNQDSSTTRGIVFSVTTSGATSLRLMTTPNNLVSLSSEL